MLRDCYLEGWEANNICDAWHMKLYIAIVTFTTGHDTLNITDDEMLDSGISCNSKIRVAYVDVAS